MAWFVTLKNIYIYILKEKADSGIKEYLRIFNSLKKYLLHQTTRIRASKDENLYTCSGRREVNVTHT